VLQVLAVNGPDVSKYWGMNEWMLSKSHNLKKSSDYLKIHFHHAENTINAAM
jgi:hypothetical protein